MEIMRVLFSIIILLFLPAAFAIRIAIDSTSFDSLSEGRLKIIMNGETGVAYYLRQSDDLNEWNLVFTDPVKGTGQEESLALTLDPITEKRFFRVESTFERRARLFIDNYINQIENGGPASLTIDGINVQSFIEISEDRENDEMVITANGVPNYIPTIMGFDVTNGWDDAVDGGFASLKLSENNLGASGGNNPNGINLATEIFRIPLSPVNNAASTDTTLGAVGVAVNGIPIYNPFENPFETSAYGRLFSGCCGHPQRNGVYHYHKYPTCLRPILGDVWRSEKDKCDEIDALLADGEHSPLLGFALDGWPVYGPVGWLDDDLESKLLQSSYTGANDSAGNPTYIADSGDLDDCNGLFSPTPEFPEGIYHYVMSVQADTDGSVLRYINPHFGYDLRNTFDKHGVEPVGWSDDSTYANALKSGFTIGTQAIAGTNEFTTFNLFIEALRQTLTDNGMSEIADEFEAMQIQYPYTIRKYRGNSTAGALGGGGPPPPPFPF